MKKIIIAIASIIALTCSAGAQTIVNSRGELLGTGVTGDPGSGTFDFATNGGFGTAQASGLFDGIAGADRVFTFSRNTGPAPRTDGDSNLSLTFSHGGTYIIRLSDFDITTTDSSILTASEGFTLTTGFNAPGSLTTTVTGNQIAIDVVASGTTGATGTNGFIDLEYVVTAGQTITVDYDDIGGVNDALAWGVRQTSIPEPSSALLLGLGGLALLAHRKRA